VKYGVRWASLWSANASLVSKREIENWTTGQKNKWTDKGKDEWKTNEWKTSEQMLYFWFPTSSRYITRMVKYKRLKKNFKEQLKKTCPLFYTGNDDLINRYNSTESGEVSPLPAPQICNKRCSKRHVMRRFCLSDFGECWFNLLSISICRQGDRKREYWSH